MRLVRSTLPGSAVTYDQERITLNTSYGGQTGIAGKDFYLSVARLSGKNYIRIGRGRIVARGVEVDIIPQDILMPDKYALHVWGLYVFVSFRSGEAHLVLDSDGGSDDYADDYVQVKIATCTVSDGDITDLTQTIGPVLTKAEMFNKYGYLEV